MKKNIVSSMIILSVGAIGAKLFSAIYRIVLTRILGGEGIGLYQLIFPFYSLCVILATAGIPMAVSKVIAKNPDGARSVLKKSMIYVMILSIVCSVVLALVARPLAEFQGNNKISIAYLILAFGLVFVGFSSVIRGYFQGIKDFSPSAISNILEQLLKATFGLVLAIIGIKKYDLIGGVIGAVVGIVISEIVTAVIMLILFNRNKPARSSVEIKMGGVIRDVLPIMIYSAILPFVMFVDSILIVNLLFKNFSQSVSIYLYGLESGAVATIVNLPTLFSLAVAGVILPVISQENNEFNVKSFLTLSIKLTAIILVPMVLGSLMFSKEIITLLYGNNINNFGYDGVDIASKLLTLSAINILLLGMNQVLASALQSKDNRVFIIVSLGIGVVLKLILEIILIQIPSINIFAVPISYTICYIVPLVLNSIKLFSKFMPRISLSFWLNLILSTIVSMLVIKLILNILPSDISFVFALVVAGLIYLILNICLKILEKRDICFIKYKIYK